MGCMTKIPISSVFGNPSIENDKPISLKNFTDLEKGLLEMERCRIGYYSY